MVKSERQFASVAYLQFVVYPGEMLLDGADRDEQLAGDLPVAVSVSGEGRDPPFRVAQSPEPSLADMTIAVIRTRLGAGLHLRQK